jgi:hypothetical protein
MKISDVILSFIYLLLGMILGCRSVATPSTSAERINQMIDSKTTVGNRARDLVGVGDTTIANIAEIQSLDVHVPFQLPAGKIWKVRLEHVGFRKGSRDTDGTLNPFIRSVDVILSATGQPIEIISVLPTGVNVPEFPDPDDYKQQLLNVGESYGDVPRQEPTISLSDAFSKSMGTGSAKQIIVYYLNVTTVRWKIPRASWIIHAWGMEPFAASRFGDTVPEDARNHLRTILDANTGEVYGSDTIPQPE